MTNHPNQPGSPQASEKWQVDSSAIRMLHAEYIDSMEQSDELLELSKDYEVKYDVEVHLPGDAVSFRMHVLVNGEGALPGYRIACTVQTDYVSREDAPE